MRYGDRRPADGGVPGAIRPLIGQRIDATSAEPRSLGAQQTALACGANDKPLDIIGRVAVAKSIVRLVAGRYLAFLEDVLDVFPEITTFVSGHGRDLTAAGVNAYPDTLNAMIGIVRTNVAAGRAAEQMVQDDVLKAYKAQYSLLEFLTPDALVPRVVNGLKQGQLK